MKTTLNGAKDPAYHPGIAGRHHAALPDAWSKTRLLNLLDETAEFFGLTSTDLRVMRRIALKTRAEDYSSGTAAPICYERQIDMAQSVNLSPSQWRRTEAKLHNLGFLARNTAVNGYRGGRSAADGQRAFAGLSLEPLIQRLQDLINAKAWLAHNAEQSAIYRMEVSSRRRRLILLLQQLGDHPLAAEIEESKATWARPRSYKDLDKLADHYFELESLVDKAQQEVTMFKKMIGAPRMNASRHIHNTTESINESCSDGDKSPTHTLPASKLAETHALSSTVKAAEKCLEYKACGADISVNAEFAESLTIEQMRDLADEDMRLYIDHLRSGDTPLSEYDLEKAALAYCRDLGINSTAFEAAIDQMGWRQAVLCLIIIGRNIMHPNPQFIIRSPGGAMRAMTARHKSGDLNLQASVFALWKRQTHPQPTKIQ